MQRQNVSRMTHGLFGLLALCTLFALPGCGSDEPELPKADELLVEARDAIGDW